MQIFFNVTPRKWMKISTLRHGGQQTARLANSTRRVQEKQTYCVTRAFSPRSRETRVISFDDGTINPPGCVHCHTVTLRNRYVTKSATRLNGAATYRKQDITRVTFQFPSNGIFPALIRPRKRERRNESYLCVKGRPSKKRAAN